MVTAADGGGEADAVGAQIARLRADFDQRFAAEPAVAADERIALLLVRIGATRQCLPLDGLVSFTACGRLTMLPGQHPACLGIAGHRGRAIPVYSLAVLLDAAAGDNAPRWLAVTSDGIGIGITGFDGQIQVRATDLRAREGRPGERFLHLDSLACPVVDLTTVLTPFISRMRTAATVKE
jgi:chemotaxis signal transduction protein